MVKKLSVACICSSLFAFSMLSVEAVDLESSTIDLSGVNLSETPLLSEPNKTTAENNEKSQEVKEDNKADKKDKKDQKKKHKKKKKNKKKNKRKNAKRYKECDVEPEKVTAPPVSVVEPETGSEANAIIGNEEEVEAQKDVKKTKSLKTKLKKRKHKSRKRKNRKKYKDSISEDKDIGTDKDIDQKADIDKKADVMMSSLFFKDKTTSNKTPRLFSLLL